MADMMDLAYRKSILTEIRGEENKQRKAESMKQFEIYSDRLHPYVVDYLHGQFSKDTVREMPIISSVNLAKRIVNQQATVYKSAPARTWSELDESQHEVMELIYRDMMINTKLDKSNKRFKLQNQGLLMILPKDGKLQMRVLMNHQYDVIPDPTDPEQAYAVIISGFDKFDSLPTTSSNQLLSSPTGQFSGRQSPLYSDGLNQKIADREDYKKLAEKYVVWTKEYNFMMNGAGEIESEDVLSPIPGILPFVDIASDKDYEYFVRQGQSVTDFTVQYNAALSDLANVVRMQGWGQAYLISDPNLIPDNMRIGPNYILRLAMDPNNPSMKPEFGFANASPDIAGSIQWVELLLSNFLSSRGLDPKIISGKSEASRYSSGIERLLAMLDRFEATREDFQIYEVVENQIYEIVKAWLNALSGSDLLLPKYATGDLPEESEVMVDYVKPEAVQTDSEKVDFLLKQVENGLMSRVEAIAELRNIDKERAVEIAAEIDQMDIGTAPSSTSGQETIRSTEPDEEDQEEEGDEEEATE